MDRKKKQETITFKVDATLSELLKEVPNRSEFIRAAVLTALKSGCPLCQGTGMLSPEQQKHWSSFIACHSLEKCKQCNAMHLVCGADGSCSSAH